MLTCGAEHYGGSTLCTDGASHLGRREVLFAPALLLTGWLPVDTFDHVSVESGRLRLAMLPDQY
jgi:hypothetical protein